MRIELGLGISNSAMIIMMAMVLVMSQAMAMVNTILMRTMLMVLSGMCMHVQAHVAQARP